MSYFYNFKIQKSSKKVTVALIGIYVFIAAIAFSIDNNTKNIADSEQPKPEFISLNQPAGVVDYLYNRALPAFFLY